MPQGGGYLSLGGLGRSQQGGGFSGAMPGGSGLDLPSQMQAINAANAAEMSDYARQEAELKNEDVRFVRENKEAISEQVKNLDPTSPDFAKNVAALPSEAYLIKGIPQQISLHTTNYQKAVADKSNLDKERRSEDRGVVGQIAQYGTLAQSAEARKLLKISNSSGDAQDRETYDIYVESVIGEASDKKVALEALGAAKIARDEAGSMALQDWKVGKEGRALVDKDLAREQSIAKSLILKKGKDGKPALDAQQQDRLDKSNARIATLTAERDELDTLNDALYNTYKGSRAPASRESTSPADQARKKKVINPDQESARNNLLGN